MAILISPKRTLVDGSSHGELFIKSEQVITQEFLDDCKAKRNASTSAPMGNLHQFASIPRALYDAWMAEGFDPAVVGAAAVMARLSRESLDSFITTDRKL